MRILLVNAYPAASAQGCERFARFRSFVLSVVDELERSEVTRVELIVSRLMSRSSLTFNSHTGFVFDRKSIETSWMTFSTSCAARSSVIHTRSLGSTGSISFWSMATRTRVHGHRDSASSRCSRSSV